MGEDEDIREDIGEDEEIAEEVEQEEGEQVVEDTESEQSFSSNSDAETLPCKACVSMETLVGGATSPHSLEGNFECEAQYELEEAESRGPPVGLFTFVVVRSRYAF